MKLKLQTRTKYFAGFLLFLLMCVSASFTVRAAGQVHALVISGDKDTKSSASKMFNCLKQNKLPKYKTISTNIKKLFYHAEGGGIDAGTLNDSLELAFGSSTSSDLNILYYSGHGNYVENAKHQVITAQTGIGLNNHVNFDMATYKFSDLALKLSGYRGKFVVILDCCVAENFYLSGVSRLSSSVRNRFTCLLSSKSNQFAYGNKVTNNVAYTNRLLKGAGYSSYKKLPADSAVGRYDGVLTAKEIFSYTDKNYGVPKIAPQTPVLYGNDSVQLFQMGYLKLKKSSVSLNLYNKKTLSLSSSLSKHRCSKSRKVKWTSSNHSVASVSSTGKVTAKKTGRAVITAYLTDSSGNRCLGSEAKCTVTVKKPSIKLSPAKASIAVGCKQKLKVTVTNGSQKVTWTSSKKSVASVSSSGVVTAKKKGTAVITARANGVTAKCRITVTAPSVKLSPAKLSLQAGTSSQLKATVKGKSKRVTWSSSNFSVAAVNSKGKITAKKEGTAVITAAANGKTAKCTVTVTDFWELSPYLGQNINTVKSEFKKRGPTIFDPKWYQDDYYCDGGTLSLYCSDNQAVNRIVLKSSYLPLTSSKPSLCGLRYGMMLSEAEAAMKNSGWTLAGIRKGTSFKKYETYYTYKRGGYTLNLTFYTNNTFRLQAIDYYR